MFRLTYDNLYKKFQTLFVFAVAFLPFANAFPQAKKTIPPNQYRTVHWTIEHGLSSDATNTMIKDATGFMWIGSFNGGFCRFDGARFKKYLPHQTKRGAINSDKIRSFKEDGLKNLWIETDKGISRYDSRADTFTNFSAFVNSTPGPYGIAPFWSTKNEIFCMEPGGLITAFNIYTLERRKLVALSKELDHTIRWNTNKSFYEASSKSIWKLGEDEKMQGVLQQIFLNGNTKIYSWPCFRPGIKHRHNAEDIRYDAKRNSVWINSGDGLIEFSLVDKQFGKVEALNLFTNEEKYDRGVGIDLDKHGRVWFSSNSHGIFVYDPIIDIVRQVFTNPIEQKAGDANLHIYCDRDGITWTSNWLSYGIYEIMPYDPPVIKFAANPKKTDSLSHASIHSIIPASQAEIWIGTRDGLNIFNSQTQSFRVLREKDLPGIKGKLISPVHIDTVMQKAWLSCSRTNEVADLEFYEMDMKSGDIKPIVFMNKGKMVDNLSITPDFIFSYKNGLLMADENHGIFQVEENSLVAELIIPFKSPIGRMVVAEDRKIFVQRGNEIPNFSFENKNGTWIKTKHILDSLEWMSMFYNTVDKTYWVSFKYQLTHYDKNFSEIKTYSQDEGFNGMALNMLTDNSGNLWFTNNLHQINRLDIRLGIITNIFEKDEKLKQTFIWLTPAAKDSRGILYFGAVNFLDKNSNGGLNVIYPERYSSRATSSVYLRSLSINQKPFYTSTSINSLEEISLRYNQNTISIETGIIDYYSKGEGHLRYKLVVNGKEEEWSYAPAYYTIRYEGLRTGNYKVIMQASNAMNEFNSPEKSFSFEIVPPFWRTWWFRIGAIVFILGLFYVILRWRLKEKFKIQLDRSEKEKQVAELRQKATEMEMQALRAQMNPHFIFNSLNSINRFILQNNRLQASEYLTKFSKLVRLILQNSQASLIPLESELESLEIYLNLEALRFNYHFDYKVSYSKDLDVSALQVPPLILQPYVENAIWHGLMHKEEKGLLEIEISEHEDHLLFTISDNGIGRKQAAAMSSKSATKHKSMGLRITANRIAMIQNNGTMESPVIINDLVHPDGSAAGTEVVIKMPLIYD